MSLLPCPFCGNDAPRLVKIAGDWGYTPDRAYVQCTSCGVATRHVQDEWRRGAWRPKNDHVAEAEAAWNRRA